MGHCLVKILGCFESTLEADTWSRAVATREVTQDDVLVAQTCEWIYPNGADRSAPNAHYRIDELQRIMDAASRNPKAVQSYKEWKAEQDRVGAEQPPPAAQLEDASESGAAAQ